MMPRIFTNGVRFISPAGNDAAYGARSAPMATLRAAAIGIGGHGEIRMLAGDYIGTKLDYSGLGSISIIGEGTVNVFLGEKVLPAAWSLHSGSTYKATVSTVIPNTGDSTQDKSFVFEWGTAEGAITSPLALEQGRTNRLDHSRLIQGASKDTLTGGQWFYETGTLYVRATDSANLTTANRTYWIPSRTATDTFVNNSGGAAYSLSVSGINIFFANKGIILKSLGSWSISNCQVFGSAGTGILADSTGTGEITSCETAANGGDGVAESVYSGALVHTISGLWSHDNGNQGHSAHGIGAVVTISASLLENNGTGGSYSVQDSTVTGDNVVTRDNAYCGVGGAIASTTHGSVQSWTNWTSIGDYVGVRYNGAYTGTPKTLTLGEGCSIIGPWTSQARNTGGYTVSTGASDDRITVAADFVGDHTHGNLALNGAGSGTATFL